MIYLEYEAYKQRFRELQRIFNDLLLEKERLFTAALPGAIRYDKDRVQAAASNATENYIVALDEKGIDEHLDKLRPMINDFEMSMRLKEIELRKSPDIIDKIYVSKFLDGYSVNYTAKRINYSRRQTYRLYNQIICSLRKDGTKWHN